MQRNLLVAKLLIDGLRPLLQCLWTRRNAIFTNNQILLADRLKYNRHWHSSSFAVVPPLVLLLDDLSFRPISIQVEPQIEET